MEEPDGAAAQPEAGSGLDDFASRASAASNGAQLAAASFVTAVDDGEAAAGGAEAAAAPAPAPAAAAPAATELATDAVGLPSLRTSVEVCTHSHADEPDKN